MNEKHSQTEKLIDLINPLITQLGYEVVHLEVINNRQRTLRIFIDFREARSDSQAIGIEDCIQVTRVLDEPLDQLLEVENLFKGPYELEVSSPGVDRPLRTPKDYERFCGKEARIQVYRPLNAEELKNPSYQLRNPKQKNFLGTLKGFHENRVLLEISNQAAMPSKNSKKKAQKKAEAENGSETQTALPQTNSAEEVAIPFPLIAKANLEPQFLGLDGNERE